MTRDSSDDSTPPTPPPANSVIQFIEQKTGEAPRVALRAEDSANVSAPVIDATSAEKLAIPQGRGNYQLMGEIARGGMGVVLKGHDTDLGRDVAVKVLDARLAERMDVVQRFVEEAQIGGQLQHPGIVPVYDLGLMGDDRPYFTMKLVKGRTLATLLANRENPRSERARMIDIFESVCQTMAYAHSRGVIHRDLKPANIMVGAFGEVQVVDWGLAKVLARGGTADEKAAHQVHTQMTVLETVRSEGSGSGSESMFGSVLGTPAYMPPEQARGHVDRLDERADVFALGAILCEILTGVPPYLGERDEVIGAASLGETDDAFGRLDACEADAELVKLAKQCLMSAPAARPGDAGVVAERVHAYVVTVEDRAHRAEVEATAARVRAEEERKARKLTLALGAAVVAVVLVGGGGWLFVQNERAAQERAETARLRAAAEQDRQLAGEVNEALNAASVFAGAQEWDEAVLAAERARALAEGGGASDELLASVDSTLDGIRAGVDEARVREELRLDTQRLLSKLREAGQPSEGFDEVDKAQAFRETFLAHGIDLDAGELEEAAALLTRRGLGADVARALDTWGSLRREQGDAEGAERLLDLAHIVDPDEQRAHLRAAMFDRNLEELRYLATSSLEGQPPGTVALLASALLRLEERDLALSVFRAGVENHPRDFELHYMLARELTPGPDNAGVPEELAEAAPLWRAALAIQPETPLARLFLGRVLKKAGYLERAIVQYEAAVDMDPDDGVFRFRLAQIQGNLERFDEATANFRRTAEMDEPEWIRGWSLSSLSWDALLRGDPSSAPGFVRAAWETRTAENWRARTWMLVPLVLASAVTEDEDLVLEARELVTEWSQDGWTPRSRGLIHNILAWAIVKNVAGVERVEPLLDRSISAAAEQVLLVHAVELARIAVDHAPMEAEVWNTLGQAHYRAGEFEDALPAFLKENELERGGDAINWLCLAMTHHALGNEAVARDWYDRAVDWMAANETDEAMQWYRAEAARVLR